MVKFRGRVAIAGLVKAAKAAFNGVLIYELPPDKPGDATFRVSASGTPEPGAPQKNWVLCAGWNLNVGGGRINAALPGIGVSIESFYWNGGDKCQEAHLIWVGLDDVQHRIYSVVYHQNGTGSIVMHEGSSHVFYGQDPTHNDTLASIDGQGVTVYGDGRCFRHLRNNQGAVFGAGTGAVASIEFLRVDPQNHICIGGGVPAVGAYVAGCFGTGHTPGNALPSAYFHARAQDPQIPCFRADLAEGQQAPIFTSKPFRVEASGAVVSTLPTVQPADADLKPGQVASWWDAGADRMRFRIRRPDGTYTDQ
jgi:hypothetical protein